MDDGCSVHPSCLACPEEVCLFERADARASVLWQEDARRLRAEGLSYGTIGQRIGRPKNSVRYALTRAKASRERVAPDGERCTATNCEC
jgi:hypothetical protein